MSSQNKIDKLSVDELTKIVNNSTTAIDSLKQIGYTYPNSIYATILFNRCKDLGINYDHIYYDVIKEKPCAECGEIKPLEEFYNRRTVCKDCVRLKEKTKHNKRRDLLNEYKHGKTCAKCGENRFYVLDFHHINPEEKSYTISKNTRIKLENLQKEIDKCVLLCANCHREFHYLNHNKGTTIKEYLEEWDNGSPSDC